MTRYSVKTLIELSDSKLVSTPEFKFSSFEKVDPASYHAEGHRPRRRSSNHHHQRPAPPVAIIPNHMLAASKEATPASAAVVEEENEDESEEGTPDADDELAAHYFLRRQELNKKKNAQSSHPHGTTGVQLSYAAALAHTSTIGRQPLEGENDSAVGEEEEAGDDGWISVSQHKPRRKSFTDRRARGSFSRWRRDSSE